MPNTPKSSHMNVINGDIAVTLSRHYAHGTPHPDQKPVTEAITYKEGKAAWAEATEDRLRLARIDVFFN